MCVYICLSTCLHGNICNAKSHAWMILLDSNNPDKVVLLSFPLKTANVLIL